MTSHEVEVELRRMGHPEVERFALAGAERALVTDLCRNARGDSQPRKQPRKERQVRAALHRLGYRLSQRNGGFVILNGQQQYVHVTGSTKDVPEVPLSQISAWLDAQPPTR